MNKYLQVETRNGPVWGDSVLCAVRECNYGCIGSPMISYPDEEQTTETLAVSLAAEIIEVPVTQTRDKTRQVANTHVQHVVNTVEAEVPLSQFIDQAVEIPVVAQRQISMVQTIQKSVEIHQSQYCDDVIDVPVVSVVQVPRVWVVKKTVEDPQFQIVEKTVENPETQTIQGSDVQVSQVQVVENGVVIPQLLIDEKIVVVPEVRMVRDTLISESLDTEIIAFIDDLSSVASKGLNDYDCGKLLHVGSTSGSMHQQRTSGQAGKEEREKKKNGRERRKGERQGKRKKGEKESR